MLKDILAVSGKPGLYKLVSKGNNITIVESLTDKKRIPTYASDKVLSLSGVSIFTVEGDTAVGEVLTAIKEKEGGAVVSIDVAKAGTDELRAYLAEVLPDFDREKVYPSDIRKLLKWYDLLITNGITDFSVKEEENTKVVETDQETGSSTEEDKEQKKTTAVLNVPPTANPGSRSRKGVSMMSANTAKTPKAKSMPKSAIPKKSIVGSKRGS